MKLRDCSRTVDCVAILVVLILAGCATTPIPEVSERTGEQALPTFGKRVELPAKRFSIVSPPANWERTKEKENSTVVVAWKSSATKSVIQVHAFTPSGLSYRGLAEIFMTALRVAMKEKNRDAVVTLAEEREVSFNGKTFYQIVADCEFSPVEGIQAKGKFLVYLRKTEKFDYGIGLTSILGFYDQDRLVIDQIARSLVSF